MSTGRGRVRGRSAITAAAALAIVLTMGFVSAVRGGDDSAVVAPGGETDCATVIECLAERPAEAEPLHQRHAAFGVDCAARHGGDLGVAVDWQATCTACHGSYDDLAARSAGLYPNPHYSHMGQPACTSCHVEHGTPVFTCNACHVFEMEMPELTE